MSFCIGGRVVNTTEITPAEKQVLDKLCEGKSDKIIAHELGRAEGTVAKQMQFIFRRLGVTNRTQAVLKTIGDQR
jgi:DNA-binding NarL/FixJ family response regulator